MFKGTIRSNLDPFGTASDNELWHALGEQHEQAQSVSSCRLMCPELYSKCIRYICRTL